MADDTLVPVSPRHSVRIAEEYLAILKKAQHHDFVVRTIAKKEANGTLLMSAELVIAGRDTREAFELAQRYPLHFRKTFFPGSLSGDPAEEFANQARAAELLDIPPPIGHDRRTFRTCLLPGTSIGAISPFRVEPDDAKLRNARALDLPQAIGHWDLTERAYERLLTLHGGGLIHGDAVLENFVVVASPLEVIPIDFETSRPQGDLDDAAWQTLLERDFDELFRHAVLLQCRLGPQSSPLGTRSLGVVERLFRDPARLRAAVEQRADLDA